MINHNSFSLRPPTGRGLLTAGFLMAALALSACETAEGFGQDVEDLGEDIQEEAD